MPAMPKRYRPIRRAVRTRAKKNSNTHTGSSKSKKSACIIERSGGLVQHRFPKENSQNARQNYQRRHGGLLSDSQGADSGERSRVCTNWRERLVWARRDRTHLLTAFTTLTSNHNICRSSFARKLSDREILNCLKLTRMSITTKWLRIVYYRGRCDTCK